MWPQRVELRFTGKTPIAGNIEGVLPSGAGGYPVRGELSSMKTKKQRWDGYAAGSPRRGSCRSRSRIECLFGARPPRAWDLGSEVRVQS